MTRGMWIPALLIAAVAGAAAAAWIWVGVPLPFTSSNPEARRGDDRDSILLPAVENEGPLPTSNARSLSKDGEPAVARRAEALPSEDVVRGTVTDPFGKEVAHAAVELRSGTTVVTQTSTDVDGAFRLLPNRRSDLFDLGVTALGLLPFQRSGVRAGQTLHVVLRSRCTLRGRVTDVVGRPIEGATILVHVKGKIDFEGGATSGNDGRYRALEIPAFDETSDGDRMTIIVSAPGFASNVKSGPLPYPGREETWDFDLDAGETLAGSVIDERLRLGIDQARVTWISVSRGLARDCDRVTVLTDRAGAYRFEHLPAAARSGYVVVEAAGFETEARTCGGATRDAPRTGLDFELAAACVVRGRVVDRNGRAVRGAAVWGGRPASARGNRHWLGAIGLTTRTDDEGRFELEDLPRGTRVAVNAAVQIGSTLLVNEPGSGMRAFETSADGDSVVGDIVVSAGATARLRVVDEDGVPICGAEFVDDQDLVVARTGDNGYAELTFDDRRGYFSCSVRRDGFAIARVPGSGNSGFNAVVLRKERILSGCVKSANGGSPGVCTVVVLGSGMKIDPMIALMKQEGTTRQRDDTDRFSSSPRSKTRRDGSFEIRGLDERPVSLLIVRDPRGRDPEFASAESVLPGGPEVAVRFGAKK